MSVDRFCREWIALAGDPAAAEGKSRRWQSCNVFYNGRTIYSYGTHFPMGYMLSPGVVWLNGDRYSPTTTQHQNTLRAAAQGRVTAVIVPGSALSGAGVDYRTIEPVHIEPQRFDTIAHESDTAPAGMVPADYPPGPGLIVGTIESERRRVDVTLGNDGIYRWNTYRHWLGDSVFTAIRDRVFNGTVGPRSYWLSSFDRQESRPLYFLSQLPRPADTVDDAIDALAPDSVKTARDMGRTVVRQGDIFAIETTLTTRQLRAAGARFTRRAVSVRFNRRARQDMAIRDALRTIVDGMPARAQRIYPGTTCSRGAVDALSAWHDERIEEWRAEVIARYQRANPDHPPLSPWGIDSALRYQPRIPWDQIRDISAEPLLGTAHTATEVATMPNGIQYARGVMYHEPAIIGETWRRRDHARRPLSGKTWFIVARNTVPVTGPGSSVRRAS